MVDHRENLFAQLICGAIRYAVPRGIGSSAGPARNPARPRLRQMTDHNQDDSGRTIARTISAVPPPLRRERRPTLIFLKGELMAASIPLERDEVVLGRAVEADIRVNDARISR